MLQNDKYHHLLFAGCLNTRSINPRRRMVVILEKLKNRTISSVARPISTKFGTMLQRCLLTRAVHFDCFGRWLVGNNEYRNSFVDNVYRVSQWRGVKNIASSTVCRRKILSSFESSSVTLQLSHSKAQFIPYVDHTLMCSQATKH